MTTMLAILLCLSLAYGTEYTDVSVPVPVQETHGQATRRTVRSMAMPWNFYMLPGWGRPDRSIEPLVYRNQYVKRLNPPEQKPTPQQPQKGGSPQQGKPEQGKPQQTAEATQAKPTESATRWKKKLFRESSEYSLDPNTLLPTRHPRNAGPWRPQFPIAWYKLSAPAPPALSLPRVPRMLKRLSNVVSASKVTPAVTVSEYLELEATVEPSHLAHAHTHTYTHAHKPSPHEVAPAWITDAPLPPRTAASSLPAGPDSQEDPQEQQQDQAQEEPLQGRLRRLKARFRQLARAG